jgi:NTE family protein
MNWLNITGFAKNSLFLVSLIFIVSACQNLKSRNDEKGQASVEGQQVPVALSPTVPKEGPVIEFPANSPTEQPTTVPAPPTLKAGEKVKIGVILGPGGLRAYAHIGVLQELSKAKIPIYAISGLEMGSLVGAIYASKGQIYDVEWQMMKLKEDEFFKKNLMFSRSPQDVNNLQEFMQTSLGNFTAEDAKVLFSCPSYNLQKRQIYLMNRGPFVAMLPYCIPYYPFFRPYQQNIAGVNSLLAATKNLRSRGANYLIYIDLLDEKSTPFFDNVDSQENVTWSTVADGLRLQLQAVNKILPVYLQHYYLSDFEKRREMIQNGQEAGRKLVEDLQRELGF